MLLDPRVPEQAVALASGRYEPLLIDYLLARARENDVFVDIGANIGLFTCPVARHCRRRGGHVYAIEPVTSNVKRLRENLRLNRLEACVTVCQTALGVAAGTLTMHVVPEGEANNAVGDNMLSEGDRRIVAEQCWRRETVRMERLDNLAGECRLNRCEWMKIDVEGAELNALRGGVEFLKRCRPTIFGEFNPYWMRQIGQTFQDVLDFFAPLQYRAYREIHGTFIPMREELIAKETEIPLYLLMPKEKLDRALAGS